MGWIEKYKIKGEHGIYVVSLKDDGTWGCSCPQWKFRRIECHHIDIVKMLSFNREKFPPVKGTLFETKTRYGDGEKLFVWKGSVERVAELLTGMKRTDWILVMENTLPNGIEYVYSLSAKESLECGVEDDHTKLVIEHRYR